MTATVDATKTAQTVTRVLPVKGKRVVGPWCFLAVSVH
jgi:hypothetical protein